MANSLERESDPGPVWFWITAWSLQGCAILAIGRVGLPAGLGRFVAQGLAAAMPLLGLYWVIRAR